MEYPLAAVDDVIGYAAIHSNNFVVVVVVQLVADDATIEYAAVVALAHAVLRPKVAM